ncbi:MAG TPA: FAD:protein FMN transferase [Nakamurella sp.]|nr:FAD:protein FMN transferase [Nakamurella sp.]
MVCHTADIERRTGGSASRTRAARGCLIAVVPIRSGAAATSGTAHRGQHLMEPRTGLPVEGVASVTVIGPSLTWADIDATAAYARGVDAAAWLSGRPGRTGLIVGPDRITTIIDGRPNVAGCWPITTRAQSPRRSWPPSDQR